MACLFRRLLVSSMPGVPCWTSNRQSSYVDAKDWPPLDLGNLVRKKASVVCGSVETDASRWDANVMPCLTRLRLVRRFLECVT
jgi:hypothetical protein